MISYYVIALIVLLILNFVLFPRLMSPEIREVDYGEFLQMVENGEVKEVQIESNQITFGDYSQPEQYYRTGIMNEYKLIDRLYDAGLT